MNSSSVNSVFVSHSFVYFALFVLDAVYCRILEEPLYKQCESYSEQNVTADNLEPTSDGDSVNVVQCKLQSEFCFVLWRNDSGRISVKSKGCFENGECEEGAACVGNVFKNHLLFCCCRADLCNRDFVYESASLASAASDDVAGNDGVFLTINLLCILLSCIGSIVFVIIFRFKLPCLKRDTQLIGGSEMPPSPILGKLLPIDLIECKAKGQFGAVWKARLKNDVIAVKIVPADDKQSWFTEREIFQLPRMDHDNVLKFVAAEKHGDNQLAEYWLITAYHELGSLFDYLKGNTVTWEQLCIISFTMARGLAHLHEEVPSVKSDCYKPSIAHRDFKSNNVLLKSDLSACVADFGLALIFRTRTCGSTHGQVGTRQYMAPEILQGTINFSNSSFLAIDMYACGLVLWEILTRCTMHDEMEEKYKLPFETELGEHPNIEDMRSFVVDKKGRPILHEAWRRHTCLSYVCDVIEECWDADADARLSAACVTERFSWHLRSTVKNETKLLYNIT